MSKNRHFISQIKVNLTITIKIIYDKTKSHIFDANKI